MLAHGVEALLCIAAFGVLAMAMVRHQEDMLGRELSARQTAALRVAGWLLLAVALWWAVWQMGWSRGLVAYSGHTSLGAGVVFIALLLADRTKVFIAMVTTSEREKGKS